MASTRLLLAFSLVIVLANRVAAQSQPLPDEWTGSLAAGLALTGGNTSTTTTNFSFDLHSPDMARNVIKVEGLNIRSSRDGNFIVDRTSASVRDEYLLIERGYAFVQFQYLRDLFKSIDFLISPTIGVGYKLAEGDVTNVSLDASAGTVVEQNPGVGPHTSGALTLRQNASRKLSESAMATQSVNALWKVEDFGDALYTFRLGVASNVTRRIQLKAEFLDTFKNEPPNETIKRNDTAFITSFGFTF
jgi:putative salt-induced outer membrane protein YdiY